MIDSRSRIELGDTTFDFIGAENAKLVNFNLEKLENNLDINNFNKTNAGHRDLS